MRFVSDKNLIKTIMEDSGVTQKQLAESMGYEDQSAVSQLVNRKRCSLDKAISALNKMGCSIIIRRRGVDLYEVVTEWEVGKRG